MGPPSIVELLANPVAIAKLGARGISLAEARQLPRNAYVVVRNPTGSNVTERRLLVGRTDGGRALTLVIERTLNDDAWMIVTGWRSTIRERRLNWRRS
ncbi:hypothetical protein VSS74_17260 [Conexibacter stalactiti]|uniref:DUF4258 domain-containing protein n=1 Tax=Conexibacter stalactiti TaxID=1940611 RepID=A0ABU4HTI9_9ACTN|nr:hypothetical protein [Conexibacter stalactiti]MDW5596099.1 hypothetical protein [Conexibacter stalactiti]MEC5036741.1 hypothetical protein [Conexibacter stalactiti]